jgi:hypothetical protein
MIINKISTHSYPKMNHIHPSAAKHSFDLLSCPTMNSLLHVTVVSGSVLFRTKANASVAHGQIYWSRHEG